MSASERRRQQSASDYPSPERLREERRLRGILEESRQRLDVARAEYQRLTGICRDLDPAHPDGIAALRTAMNVYQSARKGYLAALRAFADFASGRSCP
jgi:hypothetical protein